MPTIYLQMPYSVNIDETVHVTQINTLFVQGDNSAHKFILKIHKGGELVDLSGVSVKCKFTSFAQSQTIKFDGNVEDGKAVAVLKEDCYKLAGRFALTISLVTDNECTVFYGDGYMRTIDGESVVTGDYIIYDLNTLISKINEIDEAILRSNAATESAETSASNAKTATGNARTAADNANRAANRASDAADAIEGMTATATTLETGQAATASVTVKDGHYQIALGLPRGRTGATPVLALDVATGEPGTEAMAVRMEDSTPENPHYLLTIPRGDVGEPGNLKVNGKKPGADGSVEIGIDDIAGLRAAIDGAGGVKTVAGLEPDEAGDVPLTAQSIGAMSATLLWQNASPGTEMAADADGVDSIQIDWTGYTHALIIYNFGTSANNQVRKLSHVLPVVAGTYAFLNIASAGYDILMTRELKITDGGLHVYGASRCNKGTITSDVNTYIIPFAIYGIEGVTSNA